MTDYSDIDALREVNDALSKLHDSGARQRVLTWMWDKYGEAPVPATAAVAENSPPSGETAPKKKKISKKKNTKQATGSRPSLNKDLNLRPKNKKSFADFAAEKQPKNNFDRCVVAVYYLRRKLDVVATMDNVFTCFKDVGWRVPADLRNALQSAASRKGFIDTKETNDMKMTTLGENHVEHDLPAKPK